QFVRPEFVRQKWKDCVCQYHPEPSRDLLPVPVGHVCACFPLEKAFADLLHHGWPRACHKVENKLLIEAR
uniref:Uncharacterized protein n=1 Tax=Anopheles albimanus TaxID=7167 RepID=A0A182FYF1_ANOAL